LVAYNQAGNYDVFLTVSNSAGTSPQLLKSNYIHVSPASGNFIAPTIESFSNASFPINTDPSLNWQIESPNSSAFQWERNNLAFFNGPASLKLDNYNISNEEYHSIISPVCDLSQLNQAYLNFWLAYTRKSQEIELMNIYVSYNCGLSWVLLKSELSVNLYSSNPIPNFEFIPTSSDDWNLYTLPLGNLAGQDNLKFKIEFKSLGGNNIYIDEFQITESPVSGIGKNGILSSAAIYPNPNKGLFRLNNNDFKKFKLYNNLGLELAKGVIDDSEILEFDFQTLPNGHYLMILENQLGLSEHHKILIFK
jgi:hypothetical protein